MISDENITRLEYVVTFPSKFSKAPEFASGLPINSLRTETFPDVSINFAERSESIQSIISNYLYIYSYGDHVLLRVRDDKIFLDVNYDGDFRITGKNDNKQRIDSRTLERINRDINYLIGVFTGALKVEPSKLKFNLRTVLHNPCNNSS